MDKLSPVQLAIFARITGHPEVVIAPEIGLQMMQYCDKNGHVDERHHRKMADTILDGRSTNYNSKITLAKAQPLALQRSKAIFENWTSLQKVLDKHEGVIRKRWLKKSQKQRTDIIKAAWNRPDLASFHRPDFVAFKKEGNVAQDAQSKFRDAYLWPYINTEDLVRGKTLLAFINSRGRHPPDLFIHADHRSTHFGRLSGAIRYDLSEHLTMMFIGRHTPETYGQILCWDDEPEARHWLESGIAFTSTLR